MNRINGIVIGSLMAIWDRSVSNMKCRHLWRVATLAFLALSFGYSMHVQATPPLYVADGNLDSSPSLHIMDPTTGLVITTIGPIGFRVTGLAFHPTTGVLYGSTNNKSNSRDSIITIDITTGAGTLVGPTGRGAMGGLAFDASGTLYGWNGGFQFGTDDLHTINLATGAATLVGDFGAFTSGNGLAFTSDGTLFLDPRCDPAFSSVPCSGGAAFGLATINPLTGLQVGTLPLSGVSSQQFFNAMDFDPDTGLLFGISRFVPLWALMSIDPVTGQVTQIGPEQFANRFDGLAFQVVLDSDGDGVNDNVDTCPNSHQMIST